MTYIIITDSFLLLGIVSGKNDTFSGNKRFVSMKFVVLFDISASKISLNCNHALTSLLNF